MTTSLIHLLDVLSVASLGLAIGLVVRAGTRFVAFVPADPETARDMTAVLRNAGVDPMRVRVASPLLTRAGRTGLALCALGLAWSLVVLVDRAAGG